MAIFKRSGTSVPSSVADAVALPKGERVLTWAKLASGRGHVVLTISHIRVVLVGADALGVLWDQVAHAEWEDPLLTVTFNADGRQHRLTMELDTPGTVPQVLRERVQSTVIFECYRMLPIGSGARFVARRGVGAAAVRWSVIFDDGNQATNSEARAAADEVLVGLKADLGL